MYTYRCAIGDLNPPLYTEWIGLKVLYDNLDQLEEQGIAANGTVAGNSTDAGVDAIKQSIATFFSRGVDFSAEFVNFEVNFMISLIWTIWLINQFINLIILLNFLIAVIS